MEPLRTKIDAQEASIYGDNGKVSEERKRELMAMFPQLKGLGNFA